jgi:hypothetical protein
MEIKIKKPLLAFGVTPVVMECLCNFTLGMTLIRVKRTEIIYEGKMIFYKTKSYDIVLV